MPVSERTRLAARAGEIQEVITSGPVAVIGDIHGRLDLLTKLNKRLGVPLFFVGDLVDRGPDSKGVVQFLIDAGARGVRGNHEEWLRRYADGRGFDTLALKPHMGGEPTLASYGISTVGGWARAIEAQHRLVPLEHRRWLLQLPIAMRLVVDDKPFWLVHAGLTHYAPLTIRNPRDLVPYLVHRTPEDLLWNGAPPEVLLPADCPVISGHRPRREPIDVGHAIAIDTGCGVREDGTLTAVLLPSRQFVSVGP